MGDMAELTLEREYFSDIFSTDDGFRRPESFIKCRYCGETGLTWKKVSGRWRLINGTTTIHKCDSYIVSQFEDLSK